MALFIGVALMALGAGLAWSLGGQFWLIWRGVTALALGFIGFVTLLIALSERRAKKQYRDSTQNSSDQAQLATPDET